MRAKLFLIQKTPSARIFCYQKNLRTHIFFWVWRFSPNSGSKSPNSFFSKKKRNLKNTHTQRLSLENSPNSRVEFGDFPELRFKRNKIPKNMFFFKNQNEFGEFSKFKCWVWRILQTQIQKNFFLSLEISPNSRVEFGDFLQTQVQNLQTHFFRKKNRNLKNTHTQRLSLENSPNSRVEFGDLAKLRFKRNKIPKTCFFQKPKWVWRILQTQVLSLENSPNSDSKEFFLSLENSPNSMVEFGDFLQTQGLSLEIFSKLKFKISKLIFFEKKSKFKKYTHSEVEFGEFSKLKGWVWRFPRTQIQKKQNPENMFFFSKTKMSLENSPNSSAEFGEFSKLRFKRIFFWVWRTLQTQELSLENSQTQGLSLENSPNSSSKSPNSFFSAKQWIEKNPKLRGWVWRILQTQGLSLENSPNSDSKERFLWLWRNLRLSLENSPNSGSKSPNSFVSQKNPNSEVEFGVFSKLNGWEFSKLRLFSKTPATLNPKLYGQRPAAWN